MSAFTAPYTPQPVTDIELAFPANVSHLMPSYEDVPQHYRRDRGEAKPWIAFQRRWFFHGLGGVTITAKPGIDKTAALRHLAAIQGSFEPSHEDKEAAVAYLASLWLEPVRLPEEVAQ